jgi:hypothetical protein
MSSPKVLPDWIVESIDRHRDGINKRSLEYFSRASEISPHFDRAFLSIPPTADLGVLKSYNLDEVHEHYGVDSPLEFILLNSLELFHFQSVYQIRELGLAFAHALEEGRFYVAAITNRAMLEVVSVNYHTFRRVERKFGQSIDFLKTAASIKSSTERRKLLQKYGQEACEILSALFDASAASSIDWREYLRRFEITIEPSVQTKRIHVNSAIEDLEKASKLPLKSSYEVLCEFVHPNAGSKMLLVNTRSSHDDLMYRLRVGDNKMNAEAAMFYVDHVAESMYYTLSLALTLSGRGQALIKSLGEMLSRTSRKPLH